MAIDACGIVPIIHQSLMRHWDVYVRGFADFLLSSSVGVYAQAVVSHELPCGVLITALLTERHVTNNVQDPTLLHPATELRSHLLVLRTSYHSCVSLSSMSLLVTLPHRHSGDTTLAFQGGLVSQWLVLDWHCWQVLDSR